MFVKIQFLQTTEISYFWSKKDFLKRQYGQIQHMYVSYSEFLGIIMVFFFFLKMHMKL